jgi:hypothetical protein
MTKRADMIVQEQRTDVIMADKRTKRLVQGQLEWVICVQEDRRNYDH